MLPIVALLLAATTDLRDYCPERPGLDTPACIVDRGHVSVETSVADWTREDDADTTLLGDTLVRVGVTAGTEVQLGWSPLGLVRDRPGGPTRTRVGDAYLGVKASLVHPDGDALAVAVLPSVTLPLGRRPVGAGDWSAGLRLPASVQLSDTVRLDFTPEVDAAVDEDGDGRHLAYGSAGGVEIDLTDALTLAVEAAVLRDRDPDGRTTQVFQSTALAWGVRDDLQLDVGAVAGLTRASADIELYLGFAKRF